MDFDEDNAGNNAGPDNALNHGSDIVEDRQDSEHEMQGGTLPADHKSEGAVGGQDRTPSSNGGDESCKEMQQPLTELKMKKKHHCHLVQVHLQM